jgi:hypothetical protein
MTFTLKRCRTYFTRYGIMVIFNRPLWRDGHPIDKLGFYGNDGRKVRAKAIAWAQANGATYVR